MTIEKTQIILSDINSTKLETLKIELFETAIRYTRIRVDWCFMDDDEKRNNDELRTRTHNSLIDACNILSREMTKAGEDANWSVILGNDRKVIGDFACYVHCLLGLSSR